MKEQLKKIDNKWVRIVAFAIVVINASAKMMGYELLPFDSETIVVGVSIGGVVVVGAWSIWKNNSFTDIAKNADSYLDSMKKRIKKQQKKFND